MKRWHLVLIILLLVLWALWDHHGRTVAEARAEAQTDSAQVARAARDSLQQRVDSMATAYTADTAGFHALLGRWQRLAARARGVDTLPGTIDSIPYPVLVALADSTINACTVALSTCEQRVAAVTEQRDSAASEAAHWAEAAGQWKRVARGPFAVLAVEATTTLSWKPAAAVEATLGRGHLKALGRVDVAAGEQACAFSSTQDAYSCSTTGTVTARLGARWVF
jgi:hypothetical protein